MRNKRLGRHAAIDWTGGRFGHHHGGLARTTGVARTARHPHAQLGGHHVELLGAEFADGVHRAAAAWAHLGCCIHDHFVARQVGRQRTVVAGRAFDFGGLLGDAGCVASCPAWFSAMVCSRSSRPNCS